MSDLPKNVGHGGPVEDIRLLIVDDESRVLSGLQRMLRARRPGWCVFTAESGARGLEMMASDPVHVVIADMRMPEMDGGMFLAEVRARHPGTVRFVLSAHADRAMIVRTVAPAHRFYAKPCEADVLVGAVESAFRHYVDLRDAGVSDCVCGIRGITARVSSLDAFLQGLRGGDLKGATDCAKRDVGLALQVVRIARGGFFGTLRSSGSVGDAIKGLGAELICDLVKEGVFIRAENASDMEQLNRHSLAVARLASRIAADVLSEAWAAEVSELAGLVHGVSEAIPCTASLEPETRAGVAGRLLSLWNMSETVWKAVAHQHEPARDGASVFGVTGALHVAHALLRDSVPHRCAAWFDLDVKWLTGLGLGGRVSEWSAWARETSAD